MTINTFFSDRRIRTSLLAIAADMLMITIKVVTAWITGSIALSADAFHSVSDLLVSFVVLIGLLLRRGYEKQANDQVTLRGQRLESVIAIIVAVLILFVPIEIFREIQNRTTETVTYLWVGILGVLLVIALAYLIARLKISVGRTTDSPALEADGYHSQMDVFSSIAVLFSLVGQMIGVYLDNIVAVIIAVIVAIIGLELLVSAVRSLLQGSPLQHQSWLGMVETRLHHFPQLRNAIVSGYHALQNLATVRTLIRLIGLATVVYLLSGFTFVPPASIGVRQRLGAIVEQALPPGLYYHLPYPFERIKILSQGRIDSSHVQTNKIVTTETNTPTLWRSLILTTRRPDDVAEHALSGDEKLLDMDFIVHYRIAQASRVWQQIEDLSTLITVLAETALRTEVANMTYDSVLEQGRIQLAQRIHQRLQQDLTRIDLSIEIIAIHIQSLQPAAAVVPSYRAIADAHQLRQTTLLKTKAEHYQARLLANAEQQARLEEAIADANERRLHALGDAKRFTLTATVAREYPQAVGFNLYIDTATIVLQGKPLLVTDTELDLNDPRLRGHGEQAGLLWMPQPIQRK